MKFTLAVLTMVLVFITSVIASRRNPQFAEVPSYFLTIFFSIAFLEKLLCLSHFAFPTLVPILHHTSFASIGLSVVCICSISYIFYAVTLLDLIGLTQIFHWPKMLSPKYKRYFTAVCITTLAITFSIPMSWSYYRFKFDITNPQSEAPPCINTSSLPQLLSNHTPISQKSNSDYPDLDHLLLIIGIYILASEITLCIFGLAFCGLEIIKEAENLPLAMLFLMFFPFVLLKYLFEIISRIRQTH